MSAAAPFSSQLLPSPASTAGVGLGYGIAIAVGILVLVSTIMLASYLCVRVKGRAYNSSSRTNSSSNNNNNNPSMNSTSLSPVALSLGGLDRPVIDSFPKFVFGAHVALHAPINGPCSICLSDYAPGEMIRCVPDCKHCFHADCVDEWLRLSATCPVCRGSPAPSATSTPVATPLSELIPLTARAR